MTRRLLETVCKCLPSVLLMLILSAAGEATPRQADSTAMASAAVSAVIQHLIAADNSRDLETVLTLYTDDVVFLAPTGDIVIGKPAIRQRYQRMFQDFQPHLSCVIAEVAVSGRLAFVRGTNKGYLDPISGGPATAVNDNFVAILSSQGSAWRVSRLIWVKRVGPS